MKTVAIEYSYPTSHNARIFGFYHEGCYTVSIREEKSVPVAFCGCETIEQAREEAAKTGLPVDRYSR